MRILFLLLLACSAPALAQHEGHGEAPPAEHDHAAHGAEQDRSAAPPVAPPPPEAVSGPEHAADAVYGAGAMADAREELRVTHGGMKHYKVMLDRLEWSSGSGRDGYAWEGEAWYGGDIDKLWLTSEGEGRSGDGIERAEVQALWNRAISPWFDLQLGLRHDFRPDPERTHIVVGVQGLAPYWFEIDAAAFVSHRGEVTARVEAEYDLRLTQRLILQPRAEIDLSLQDVPAIGLGSGLSSAEAGLRLRFEIEPEFAPYVGIEFERAFGGTAALRRASGEDASRLSFIFGIRSWF